MFWSRKLNQEERPVSPRAAPRFSVLGTEVTILMDARHHLVRLKDISTSGLCGLTDAPLHPGQPICFMIDDEPVAAEIRWIRRTLIGAQFTEELNADIVQRLQRRSEARRAANEDEFDSDEDGAEF
jgi:hypothetical protein